MKAMKSFYVILLGALALGMFANCGKKDDGPKVAMEMPAHCLFMQRQNGANVNQAFSAACYYNYNAVQGYSNYNAQAGGMGGMYGGYSSTGSAGCGTMNGGMGGGAMVYSPSKGPGCVLTAVNGQPTIITNGQPVTYQLNQATGFFTPLPPGSQPYNNGMYGQNMYNPYGSMYGGYGMNGMYGMNQGMESAFRVCDTAEPCPSPYRCLSPFGTYQSLIGICYH